MRNPPRAAEVSTLSHTSCSQRRVGPTRQSLWSIHSVLSQPFGRRDVMRFGTTRQPQETFIRNTLPPKARAGRAGAPSGGGAQRAK